jgi:polyisoprenoid-binding protein YceI
MKTFVVLAALIGLGANGSFETSKVWVDGTSTVRGWKCSATEITSRVSTNDSNDIAGLVDDALVVIPVGKLECGNGKMNEHMRKALKAEQNANIEFTLNSYKVDGASATLNGTLKMAGVSKDVQIPATVTKAGQLVQVKATVPIKMTQWGIKPPSLMMGTMKVRDDVTVGFDVTLKN